MTYTITARRMNDDFSDRARDEAVQHFREGWDNAHRGEPYKRFESSYRQQGWIQYFLISGSNNAVGQNAAEQFKEDVGYYPFPTA